LATVGQLTAQSLALDAPYYDAEKHSEDTVWKLYGFGTE